MVKKYDIVEFVEAGAPLTEPVTKFGGQPVWLAEPEWPLSRELGEQMEFICQVALDSELLGVPSGKMAYLFMTGDEAAIANTWDPGAGENAIVIQPGGRTGVALVTRPLETGPSVRTWIEDGPGDGTGWMPREYGVELGFGEDPDPVPSEVEISWTDEEYDAYCDSLAGNKIGGMPLFIQGDAYPEDGSWRFLLQLDMMEVPFHVNFGDAGMGYAFLSEDGQSGRFLWQCY